jgi:hypothetical protein
MNRTPPRFAALLLKLVVPDEEQESIPGDLAEEFATAKRSNLWYWRQVMSSIGYLAWKSFARNGFAVFAGAAVMLIALVLTGTGVRTLLPRIPHTQSLEFAFTVAVLGFGVLSAAVAGYVTARFVGRAHLPTLLFLGVFLVAISSYWLHSGVGTTAPMWYRGALILLVLPCALFGGRLQTRQVKSA